MRARRYLSTLLEANEEEWQSTVVKAGRYLGWTFYHTKFAIGSKFGYPDLTCFHPELGVFWTELKTEKGVVFDTQKEWIATIRSAGQRCFVLRPRYWDAVELILKGEIDDEVSNRLPDMWNEIAHEL